MTTTAEQHDLCGRTLAQTFGDGLVYLAALFSDSSVRTRFQAQTGCVVSLDILLSFAVGGEAEEYAALAQNYCFDRSFFITSDGRMGLGPSGTQAGDVVSILLDGGVPYIIRKDDVYWKPLGESCICGLMNREGLSSAPGPDYVEILVLR